MSMKILNLYIILICCIYLYIIVNDNFVIHFIKWWGTVILCQNAVVIILHFIVLVLVHSIWKLNPKMAIRFYSVNFLYITFLLKLLRLVGFLLKRRQSVCDVLMTGLYYYFFTLLWNFGSYTSIKVHYTALQTWTKTKNDVWQILDMEKEQCFWFSSLW
jgi:hypothetical protein